MLDVGAVNLRLDVILHSLSVVTKVVRPGDIAGHRWVLSPTLHITKQSPSRDQTPSDCPRVRLAEAWTD